MMHNGSIKKFEAIKRDVRKEFSDEVYSWVRGQTDSEHFYALFLTNLFEANIKEDTDRPNEVFDILRKTILQIEEIKRDHGIDNPSLLNLVVSNGCWIVAVKYISDASDNANTLYYSSGSKYECEEGICKMDKSIKDQHSVLVVSEKLTDIKDDWNSVPTNSGLIVTEELTTKIMEI